MTFFQCLLMVHASVSLPSAFPLFRPSPRGWHGARVNPPHSALILQRLLHHQGEEESQLFSVAGGGIELHSGGKQS